MDVHYGFVKDQYTQRVIGRRTLVGVAGTLVKGRPHYLSLSVSTTQKRFLSELLDLVGDDGSDYRLIRDGPAVRPLLDEVKAYFRGQLRAFAHGPHFVGGTPFQREVWEELCRIPFGTTLSYGEVAGRIGRPGAARAVGAANHANPVALVVPCHRVIGADGSLTGYGGGGVGVKKRLLELERHGLEAIRRN